MSNTNCGFVGNSDIYGVGIRIGYYTQALAVWFSNFFFLREARDLRAVNGLFLLALAIIILVYTHNTNDSYAIEVFLLMQIGLCLGSISIMDSTRYSSKYLTASKERLLLRTILLNLGLTYNLYFWWSGLDAYQATPCGTFAFYFLRANLYGRLRTVMKVFAVAGLVWRTLFTTIYEAGKVLRRYRFKKARQQFIRNTQEETIAPLLPIEDLVISLPSEAVQASIPAQTTGPNASGNANRLSATICPDKGKDQHAQVVQQTPIPNCTNDRSKAREDSTKASATVTKDLPVKPVHSTKPRSPTDFSFPEIYGAEKYLSQILSRSLQETKPCAKEPPFYRASCLLRRTKTVVTPKSSLDLSLSAQLKNQIRIIWADQNTRYIRDTLSVHSKATGSQIHRWPIVISRLLSSTAKSPAPDWQAVAIASDIQLSQLPLIIPRKVWLFNFIQSFGIIVILIVQIELTIVWNHIQSIQALRSVEQLFPLILGVGGLAKVFWGKWKELKKGYKEDEEVKGKRLSKYELAMEKYLKWKKQQEEVETSANVNASVTPLPT